MDLKKTAWAVGSYIGLRQAIKAIQNLEADDILGLAGVQRRRGALESALPSVGLVLLSAAAGAGVALLLAPSSGPELRQRLSGQIDDAKNRLSDKINKFERENNLSSGSVAHT
jgi:hypothetical protein